ncbi:MAG: hypothetical protein J6T10_30105 [Methanobrevibacter sp.]|nr:hypothetical protein [Methanobrevibacter sp.]
MKDRFKFRCGRTISHYDDDGNDIETLLLVNNISIFDDGDVGFDRESLKESVKRENLSEEEERTLWNSLDEYEVFEYWYQMPADFIEQCTGLKDKNGKLIYEGDILGYFDNKIAVVYDNELPSFRLRGIDGSHYGLLSQEYVDSFGFKIIGNIHE